MAIQASRFRLGLVSGAVVSTLVGLWAAGQNVPTGSEPVLETPQLHFLVIDDRFVPHVRVEWPGADGEHISYESDQPYVAPAMKTDLGGNLQCYVALGGTRLDKQAGDPDGAIVRVGFYKRDTSKPLFEGMEHNDLIRITLTNVVFDKPAIATADSGLQHLKFSQDGLAECGLAGAAFELFNTVSATDNLRGIITSSNGRLGALSNAGAAFRITHEADGSFTLEAEFPYELLRHVQDPWQLTKPGTFLEPLHFHIEFEAVPLLRVPDALRPIPVGDAGETLPQSKSLPD